MIRLGIIGALGVYFDILLASTTSALWKDLVHKAVVDQKVEAGWANAFAWTVIDGAFAVLIMAGTGLALAAAIFTAVEAGLMRR